MDDEPPDLSTISGRLEWARRRRGYSSPRKAAAAHGWSENTYKAHEQGLRGSQGLKLTTAERYARAFGVTVQWLVTGRGDPAPASQSQREWDDLSPDEREMAVRLVRVAKAGNLLVKTVPAEEVPVDELPPHFDRKAKTMVARAVPKKGREKRR